MKKEKRRAVLQQLKAQSVHDKATYDQQVLERFLALPSYQEAETIAVYLAFDFEYNTQLIIEQARLDGKRILVPKTYPQGKMIFVDYNPEDVEKSAFGLLEPKSHQAVPQTEIDLIVVPGVVFNEMGYRIGYGAGYYDRYLETFTGRTVSLIYPCQLAAFDPEGHDIAVEEMIYEDSETRITA